MLPERLALNCLERHLTRLNQVLDRQDALPRLRFDLRGRCAGQALPRSWTIRLNAGLLQRYGEDFIEQTVPHELAHLVAYAHFGEGIRPHGAEWRELMRLLGRRPDVCHQFEVSPARRVRRHAYHCDCASHQLSSIRHRRIQQGMNYQCRRCGQALRAGDAVAGNC